LIYFGENMNAVRSLTSGVSSLLKQTGLYARLKNSCVQDLYWKVNNREIIDTRNRHVRFYRDLLRGLRKSDLVFDIGANVGQKTDVFLRLGARVVAVEPDERNQQVLRGKFITYRFFRKPVCIVGKAVSDEVAVKPMWIDGPGSALNTLSTKWVDTLRGNRARFSHTPDALEFREKRSVETTTLEELINEHGFPFFVNIDVEGYELSVLRGLRRPVPYVSFEVNLPEFREEGLQCLTILQSLDPEGQANYVLDCGQGAVLEHWANAQELAEIIRECADPCIEVLWRSSAQQRDV
jgi:FkbM family methyltransferase